MSKLKAKKQGLIMLKNSRSVVVERTFRQCSCGVGRWFPKCDTYLHPYSNSTFTADFSDISPYFGYHV